MLVNDFQNTTNANLPVVYRARWVVPVDGPPISNGQVVVEQGRIQSVGPVSADEIQACEDIALLPAFVNAHTHLEFSSLERPLGKAGMPFTDWIRALIAWRRARDVDETNGREAQRIAIARGIEESINSGVGCVGEIATCTSSVEELSDDRVAAVAFRELIGLSPNRTATLLDDVKSYVHTALASNVRLGISPHAPYTVHPKLLRRTVKICAEQRVPVAMHIAETEDELQLLRDGTGPFVDLLEELNAWYPRAIHIGSRPLDYLRLLSQAHRALVIHGNYLDEEEEWGFLANHRDRMTVVYCPRTHSYFGHPPYPLRMAVERGVRVALGTDSRASNPDLDMLTELRFAARKHSDVPRDELLRMATIHGAFALGFEAELGTLTPGKQARLQRIDLRDTDRSDPFGWI